MSTYDPNVGGNSRCHVPILVYFPVGERVGVDVSSSNIFQSACMCSNNVLVKLEAC